MESHQVSFDMCGEWCCTVDGVFEPKSFVFPAVELALQLDFLAPVVVEETRDRAQRA